MEGERRNAHETEKKQQKGKIVVVRRPHLDKVSTTRNIFHRKTKEVEEKGGDEDVTTNKAHCAGE